MMGAQSRRRAAAATLALVVVAGGHARAATTVIDVADPAGQGLNDPTPFTPVGGNPAKTLGAARLAVFTQGAALWGARLPSAVPIHVSAQMQPLPCNDTGAELASTGSGSVHRDFPSAPVAATWYPQALANALAGTDLDPATADVETVFSSTLGNSGCLTGTTFYLGLDGHPGPGQIDMLTIVLHELAHGLGFQSLVDFSTGEKMSGLDDSFERLVQQLGASPSSMPAMTDAQRVAAAVSDPDLYFSGASVQAAATTLSAGLIAGHVRLHAPSPLAPGSSVAHFSTALTPNQLMEPVYTGPTRDLTLTLDLLRDVGWSRVQAPPAVVPALPAGARALLLLALAAVGLGARASASRRTPSNSAAGAGPGAIAPGVEQEQPPPPPVAGWPASTGWAASTEGAHPPSASLKPSLQAIVSDRVGPLPGTSRV